MNGNAGKEGWGQLSIKWYLFVAHNYLNRNGYTLYRSQKNIGIDGGTTLKWNLKRSRMEKRELLSSGFGLEEAVSCEHHNKISDSKR